MGAVEWGWSALLLVQQRQALGQPWLRTAAILVLVVLLTLAGVATPARLACSTTGSSRPGLR